MWKMWKMRNLTEFQKIYTFPSFPSHLFRKLFTSVWGQAIQMTLFVYQWKNLNYSCIMKYVIFSFICVMNALNFPGFLNFNLNMKIHSYIKNIKNRICEKLIWSAYHIFWNFVRKRYWWKRWVSGWWNI